MQSQTLQLDYPLDEATALNLAHALGAVNGVSKVNISTASQRVNIDFDENMTSVQELRFALRKAGFDAGGDARTGHGGCCGGCGGH